MLQIRRTVPIFSDHTQRRFPREAPNAEGRTTSVTIGPARLGRLPADAAAVGAVIFFALFVALGLLAVSGRTLLVDQTAMLWIHRWSSPNLTTAMRLLTNLGSFVAAGPFCLAEAAAYYLSRRRRIAVILLLSVGSEPLVDGLTKLVFARPRPELWPHLAPASGFSYPSGHTLLATIAYGFSALLLARCVWQGRHLIAAFLVAAAIILVVAMSRVYLGVHYPSDVVGSMLLGTSWICIWWNVLNTRLSNSAV